jgi:hypothetical protein
VTSRAPSYKVYVILDRSFGEKLLALERGVPAWVVDTPANKPVAERLWAEGPVSDHLSGITIFDFVETASPEQIFLDEMETIDLHHGKYSADPPYTLLQVIGSPLTSRIKKELSTYGFDKFCETADGFAASRALPSE